MRNAKNILDVKSMLALYYSMVHCHLIYRIQIWSLSNQGVINNLFKLQKKQLDLYMAHPITATLRAFLKKVKFSPSLHLLNTSNYSSCSSLYRVSYQNHSSILGPQMQKGEPFKDLVARALILYVIVTTYRFPCPI